MGRGGELIYWHICVLAPCCEDTPGDLPEGVGPVSVKSVGAIMVVAAEIGGVGRGGRRK